VETAKSDMSFSVQVPGARNGGALEWSGTSLNTVFAQRSNLLRPASWACCATCCASTAGHPHRQAGRGRAACSRWATSCAHRFGDAFRDWYFLPMMGCIWSCPTDQMLQFPVATMIRFCHNHGLIQVTNRPQWWTVPAARATMWTRSWPTSTTSACARRCAASSATRTVACASAPTGRHQPFDKVVLATHSDQALALLATTHAAGAALGAIRYQPNRAVLHTDTVGAARPAPPGPPGTTSAPVASEPRAAQVCLHYLINMLQPVPWAQPVVVSLNPVRDIPEQVIGQLRLRPPGVRPGGHPRPAGGARNCRGSSTPISAAPGRATASTKTASNPAWRGAQLLLAAASRARGGGRHDSAPPATQHGRCP
jgi:predicted NAD/FAD-binding protein